MTTRMHHREHGWTHAYTPAEVEELKAKGWEVEGEKKSDPVVQNPRKPKGK